MTINESLDNYIAKLMTESLNETNWSKYTWEMLGLDTISIVIEAPKTAGILASDIDTESIKADLLKLFDEIAAQNPYFEGTHFDYGEEFSVEIQERENEDYPEYQDFEVIVSTKYKCFASYCELSKVDAPEYFAYDDIKKCILKPFKELCEDCRILEYDFNLVEWVEEDYPSFD